MSVLLEMECGLGLLLLTSVVAFSVPVDSVFHDTDWRISFGFDHFSVPIYMNPKLELVAIISFLSS